MIRKTYCIVIGFLHPHNRMGVLKMLANAASRQRHSLGSDFVKRKTSCKELDMGLSCVFKKCKIKDSEPKHH